MQEEMAYLLEHGFAVPSSSSWSSPCLLVPKSDGKFRFCTDYRKVNLVTKPDFYPLPRMDDCIERVGTAKFVTKLDLLKGYWQVPLTSRASEISAFFTSDHFLQYRRMRNAPAIFQRLMRIVLAGLENCEAYLDDIVVYSCDWEQHLISLYSVFERLSDVSLTLNLAKCEFGKAVVTYLGKCVGQGQVRPVDAKIECNVGFPAPKTKRELRRFLGMTGYYRDFCKNTLFRRMQWELITRYVIFLRNSRNRSNIIVQLKNKLLHCCWHSSISKCILILVMAPSWCTLTIIPLSSCFGCQIRTKG